MTEPEKPAVARMLHWPGRNAFEDERSSSDGSNTYAPNICLASRFVRDRGGHCYRYRANWLSVFNGFFISSFGSSLFSSLFSSCSSSYLSLGFLSLSVFCSTFLLI